MIWTAFPDQLDTAALGTLLEIWRTKTVADKRGASLHVFNIAGYATSKLFPGGDSPIVFGAEPPISDDEMESQCQAMVSGTHALGGGGLLALIKLAIKVLVIIGPFLKDQS